MNLAILVAMQASQPLAPPVAPSAAPSAPIPSDFDLARLVPSSNDSEACRSRDGTEIVVCGTRRIVSDYPLEAMARLFREAPPPRAEIGIGGGATARIYGESAEMPLGQISKRAMVGIRIPF